MRERRMSKYIISIVLALAMVIGIAVFTLPTTTSADTPAVWDGTVASGFAGGNGTEINPYQIATPAQFAYFAKRNNEHTGSNRLTGEFYVLTADLVFNTGDASTWGTTAPANDTSSCMVGTVWGYNDAYNCFAGTFDGQGHSISGFYVNKSSETAGIFCSIAGDTAATIKNLVVTNSYIKSSGNNVGAITGQTSGTGAVYDSIFITDSVYVTGAQGVGGILGCAGGNSFPSGTKGATFSNCVSGATVKATRYSGGILGNGNGGSVRLDNCLNYGTITRTSGSYSEFAGVVGNNGAVSTINYCVNIGTIQNNSGGSLGSQIIRGGSSSKKHNLTGCLALTTSYGNYVSTSNCAQINKDGFLTKGFLATSQGQKLGSGWTELAYETSIPNGTRTVKEICMPTALVTAIGRSNLDWDKLHTNICVKQDAFPAPSWILSAWNSGTVTINTVAQWKEFANFMNGVYEDTCTDNMSGKTVLLGADLDFGGEDITDYIVCKTAASGFKGTFDGQGHSISGVYMKKEGVGNDTVGLFGFTNAGEVSVFQNLIIKDSYFESEAGAVGALIAQTAGGSTEIYNVYVDADVEIVASNSYVGGLVGHVGGNGYNFIDGTPGFIADSCVNAATVTSTSTAVGGILGNGNGKSYTITNCLNMGAISGSASVGGIVGYGRAGSGVDVNIEFCVNLGAITSSSGTNVEKSCAITSMGTTVRDTLTAYRCYYLTGTASYGVFEGSGESGDGGATAVVLSVLLDATLPDGLEESGNWIARGDGTDYEVCIPANVEDFAPATTSFHTVDNTPNWLKNYSSTSSFTITTVAQWKEFADFVNGLFTTNGNFSGKTVNLGADLDFAGQNMTSYIIGAWNNPFCGNFDGQGYTISGYYVKKTGADTAGIFGSTAGGGTTLIQNLKIADSYFEAAGAVGALIGQTSGGSTEIYNVYVDSDVEIVSTGNFAGGLVGHVGQNGFDFIDDTPAVIIDSCANAATISASGRTCVGGILGNANNKSVTITNCLNLGDVTGGSNTAGILGNGTGATTTCEIYIDGCINAGSVTNTSGNVSAIANLSTSGTREATNCYFILGTADNGVISGTTVDNVRAVSVYKLGKTTLMPGLNSDDWTVRGTASYFELCVPTAIDDMIPAGTQYSLSGYDVPSWLQNYDNDSTFTINSANRFKEFANFVNGVYMDQGNFEGKTVLLSANISFNTGDASTWGDTPPTNDCTQYIVGSWANPFCGNFNGQNKTISGFYAKKEVGDGDTVAIFGATTYGGTTTIQNLLVTNSYFEAGDGAVAAVVGQAHGGTTTLNNIYVTQSVYVVSGNSFAGGVIAHLGQGSFSTPSLIVDSCVNAATISAMYDYNSEDEDEKAAAQNCTSFGGVVGNGNMKNVTITNCLNIGSVSGYQHVSGILGYGKPGSTTITGCVNAGIITSTYTGTVGKSAAITNLGNVETENYTLENNFYVTGSAKYGSFLVNAELEGGATAVAQKELCLSTLVSGLPSNKWTARGNESANPQIREICIPTAVASFAPQSPLYKTVSFLSGAGTQSNPYTVSSIADYNKLVTLSEDEDFAGKYISITTNLTFNTGSSTAWLEEAPSVTTYPIGLYTNPFRGILLGNGHTISGLYVIQRDGKANDGVGMISTTGDGAQISNLYVKNSVINDVGWAGTIAGQAVGNTTITGVYVDEDVFVNCTKGSDGNTNSGGIIGGGSSNNNFTITVDGCVFAGIVYGTGNYMGGIVGNGNGSYRNVGIRQHDVVINNCICFGQIGVGDGAKRVGGLIGANRAWTTITHSIYAGGGSKADYPDSWGYVTYPIGEMAHATVEYCYTLYTNGDENKGSVMKAIMTDDESVTSSVVYNAIDGIVNVISPAGVCSPSLANFTSGWTFRGTSTTSGAITSGTREIAIPTAVASFAPQSKFYKTFRNLTDTTLFTGDGDEVNPYVIRDVAGLQRLATVANANDLTGMYFVLKSGFTVNSGKATDWAAGNNTSGLVELTPIGNEAHPFNAYFDGYGKTIKGIYMENTGECTGLFGVVGSSATIKNTKISNSYFKDTGWVGAFVASLNGGTLDGLYAGADVIVEATSNVAGGIAGGLGANGSTVKNCVFNGTVTAAGNFVGGILGNGDGKSLTIYDCLNTGDVTGNTYVAGIVGRNDYAFSMQRCINVGAVSGTSDVYALTASNSSSKKPVVKYCYYINTLSAGKNLAETSNSGTTLDVICGVELPANLGDTWQLRTKQNGDAEYITITKHDTPVPKSIAVICAASKYTWEDAVFHQIIFAGAGTESSPYLISTVEEYQALAVYSTYVDWEGTYFKLANNIVVNEGNAEDWGSKAPAIRSYPIGSCDVPFRGTLDGNNKMLKGLYIISSGVSDATSGTAVFGSVGNGAYIHNLKISNSYFKNDQSVAAIVGQPRNAAVIENCYVASDVIVKCASSSGGIVGQLGGYNEADEYGSNDYTLEITSCVFAGKIIGSGNYLGGILGNGNNNSATGNLRYPVITKCLFAGSLTGKSYISGILGRADSRADVEYCVSIGQVGSSNQGYVSGILCSSANYEKEDDYVIVKNNYCVQALPWIVTNTKFGGRIEATNNNNCSYLDFYGSSATSVSGFTKRSNDIAVPSGVSSMAGTIFTQRVEAGASVRMSSPTGIRFTAEFSDKYLNGVVPDGGVLTGYGLMIAPKAYVDAAGGFTFEKLDTYSANNGNKITYVNVNGLESGNSTLQKSGYKVVNLVLGNVKSANYETLFSAVAYVVYNIDGETKYIYSAYDKENNARTIASVARAAVEDVSESSTTGYTNDYTFTIPTISKKQKSKKWDWDLWEYVYTYEYSVSSTSNGHLYRPYTSSQLATLQSFYSQELRVYQQNILNEYGASNYGSDVVVSADYQTQTERGIRMLKQIEQMRPDVMGFCEDSEYWTTYLNAAFGSKYTFLSDPNTGCDINEANTIAYLTSRFSLVTKGKFSNGPDPSDLDSQHTVTYEGESYHAHYSRFTRWAKLSDSNTGKTFVAAATHLDHNGSGSSGNPYGAGKLIRAGEAATAREQLATIANGLACFYVGDFNDGWTVESMLELETESAIRKLSSDKEKTGKGFFEISASDASERYYNYAGNNVTYHYYNERTHGRLDYCFYKDDYATAIRYRILMRKFKGTSNVASYPSDHYGLVSDFLLK